MSTLHRSGRITIPRVYATIVVAILLFVLCGAIFADVSIRYIAKALETRIPRSDLQKASQVDGIIVLGGSWRRTWEALRLVKKFPKAIIVLSGPGAFEKRFADGFKKRHKIVIVTHDAKSTYENALYSKEFARRLPETCWIIVTSAIHMPRAVGAFRAVKFPVLVWPVYDASDSLGRLIEPVSREVLGLALYWAFGQSSALYPSSARMPRPCTRNGGTISPIGNL